MDFLKSKSLDPSWKSAESGSVPHTFILVCPDHLLEASRHDLALSYVLRMAAERYSCEFFACKGDAMRELPRAAVPNGFSILKLVSEKQFSFTQVYVPYPSPATFGRGGCHES